MNKKKLKAYFVIVATVEEPTGEGFYEVWSREHTSYPTDEEIKNFMDGQWAISHTQIQKIYKLEE